jgi:hypothetical protein
MTAELQAATLFIPLFKQLREHFSFQIHAVMADVTYGSKRNLNYVIQMLQALPRIAKNLSWKKSREVDLSSLQGVETAGRVLTCPSLLPHLKQFIKIKYVSSKIAFPFNTLVAPGAAEGR